MILYFFILLLLNLYNDFKKIYINKKIYIYIFIVDLVYRKKYNFVNKEWSKYLNVERLKTIISIY